MTLLFVHSGSLALAQQQTQAPAAAASPHHGTAANIAPDANILRAVRDGRFVLATTSGYQPRTFAAFPQDEGDASAQGNSRKSGVKKWIFIAAAGAVAGAVIALKSSGDASDSVGDPAATITVGPPTVGPPQ